MQPPRKITPKKTSENKVVDDSDLSIKVSLKLMIKLKSTLMLKLMLKPKLRLSFSSLLPLLLLIHGDLGGVLRVIQRMFNELNN